MIRNTGIGNILASIQENQNIGQAQSETNSETSTFKRDSQRIAKGIEPFDKTIKQQKNVLITKPKAIAPFNASGEITEIDSESDHSVSSQASAVSSITRSDEGRSIYLEEPTGKGKGNGIFGFLVPNLFKSKSLQSVHSPDNQRDSNENTSVGVIVQRMEENSAFAEAFIKARDRSNKESDDNYNDFGTDSMFSEINSTVNTSNNYIRNRGTSIMGSSNEQYDDEYYDILDGTGLNNGQTNTRAGVDSSNSTTADEDSREKQSGNRYEGIGPVNDLRTKKTIPNNISPNDSDDIDGDI